MNLLSSFLPLGLAVWLWACGNRVEHPAVPVTVTRVRFTTRPGAVTATGRVMSDREVRHFFRTGGSMGKLYVEPGQFVLQGELLASLDLTSFDAQVDQAQVAVENAEQALRAAQTRLTDTTQAAQRLVDSTGIQVARQRLTDVQRLRSRARIWAKVSGTVTRILMNGGRQVAPGVPVLLVSATGLRNWVVRVEVAHQDRVRLKAGLSATVHLDAYPNQLFPGLVTEVSPFVNPINGLYEVEVRLEPTPIKLTAGLPARVTLQPTRAPDYAVIPAAALVAGTGKDAFVYVLSADEKRVRKIPVQVAFINGTDVLVTGPLAGSTQVVTGSSGTLTDTATVILDQ